MIRVIIALLGAFIIWVLFFSKFNKNTKIALVFCSILLSVLGFWFESGANKPRKDLVQTSQLSSCGVIAKHTYRTNFDIDLCISNSAEVGDVKRIGLSVVAHQCESLSACVELQRVERELSVDLPALESVTLSQNLNFSNVELSAKNIQWSFIVRSVKATK